MVAMYTSLLPLFRYKYNHICFQYIHTLHKQLTSTMQAREKRMPMAAILHTHPIVLHS